MARKLVELGVDILEAGFPIASEGDFEAVDSGQPRVSRGAGGGTRQGLQAGRGTGRPRSGKSHEAPYPHVYRNQRYPPEVQAAQEPRSRCWTQAVAAVELARRYVDDVEFSAEDATRTDPDYLEQVSKAVVAAGARTVNLPDTVGYSTPDEHAALIGRMVRALGDTAIVSVHCHNDLGLADGQLAGRRAGGRAAGGVHHQRHRRARRQLRAGRDRHGHQGPPGPPALSRSASSPSICSPPARC